MPSSTYGKTTEGGASRWLRHVIAVAILATLVIPPLLAAFALVWGAVGDSLLNPALVFLLSCMLALNGVWALSAEDSPATG